MENIYLMSIRLNDEHLPHYLSFKNKPSYNDIYEFVRIRFEEEKIHNFKLNYTEEIDKHSIVYIFIDQNNKKNQIEIELIKLPVINSNDYKGTKMYYKGDD